VLSVLENLERVDAAMPWFFPVWVFLLGACVGSFLNVCIYRIPYAQSVVRPGSHCGCGAPIRWFDNIPVLSWLLLLGRARCCGRRFSVRYPVIELLTAALFAGSWLMHSPGVAIAGMVFLSLLIGAAFIDLDHMIIPDGFSMGGSVAGVVLSFLVPALHLAEWQQVGWFPVDSLRSGLHGISGALIGSGLLLWIGLLAEKMLRREAMGFGDVKLMGAIGAFCGWQGAIFAIFGGAVFGCVLYAIGLIWRGIFGNRTNGEGASGEAPEAGEAGAKVDGTTSRPAAFDGEAEAAPGEIPFGPSLAIGAALYFVWAHGWVDPYFRMLTAELATF